MKPAPLPNNRVSGRRRSAAHEKELSNASGSASNKQKPKYKTAY